MTEENDSPYSITAYSSEFDPYSGETWIDHYSDGCSFKGGNPFDSLVMALEHARHEGIVPEKLTICYVDSEGEYRFFRFKLDDTKG